MAAASTSTWSPHTSDAYSSPTSVSPSSAAETTSASDSDTDWSLYQHYFAFVGVAIAVAIIAGFFIHRRKRQTARANRTSRQIALSRDIEDADLRRGWGWGALSRDYASGPTPHGRGRVRDAMGMTSWRRREEEGLNEAGEAPPPYKSGHEANDTLLEAGLTSREQNTQPAIPPPTLDRQHVGLKPPDYTATVVSPVESESGPSVGGATPSYSATAAHDHHHGQDFSDHGREDVVRARGRE